MSDTCPLCENPMKLRGWITHEELNADIPTDTRRVCSDCFLEQHPLVLTIADISITFTDSHGEKLVLEPVLSSPYTQFFLKQEKQFITVTLNEDVVFQISRASSYQISRSIDLSDIESDIFTVDVEAPDTEILSVELSDECPKKFSKLGIQI